MNADIVQFYWKCFSYVFIQLCDILEHVVCGDVELYCGQHGNVVVSTVALQAEGPGFESTGLSRCLSVWRLHALPVSVWVSCEYPFLPQSKDMHVLG